MSLVFLVPERQRYRVNVSQVPASKGPCQTMLATNALGAGELVL